MSDQTRLINEKIKLRSVRRDYYTDTSYNYYPNNTVKETKILTETVPSENTVKPSAVKEAESNIIYEEVVPNKTTDILNKSNTIKRHSEKKVNPIATMYPSYVRFYSLIPDDEEISIVVSNEKICENIKSNSPTEYINLEPGIYEICFYDINDNLLCEHKLKAFNCAITTLIITKSDNRYNVFSLRGTTTECFYDTSYVRFIQTVPCTPAMDIYIDGIAVILGIMFSEISVFIGLPAGIHNITVTAAATSVIYADESFNFTSESVNDMFIVSDNSGFYGLSLLANENSCL